MAPKARTQMIEQTRGKLLDAARHAFGSVGYAQTSMDELTASVGLTRGALYHHFGDKKGLLQAVVQQVDAELDVQLAEVFEQAASPWEGFKGRCRMFLEMALQVEVQRIMLRDAPSVLGSQYLQSSQSDCSASMAAMLQGLMDTRVIQPTDPEALARLIQGGLMDLSFWIAGADNPPQRLAASLDSLDLMLRGLLLAPRPQ